MSRILLAYIDPGTGSIIMQVVIGGLLGASYFMRTRIKRWLSWARIEKKSRQR